MSKRNKALVILVVFLLGMCSIALCAVTGPTYIGPNAVTQGTTWLPTSQQGYTTLGSGRFTVSSTGSLYLSTGSTVATSVPCNTVTLSVSTSSASLSTSSSAALALPVNQIVTLSVSDLNTLQVSGTGAVIGYVYGR